MDVSKVTENIVGVSGSGGDERFQMKMESLTPARGERGARRGSGLTGKLRP